MWSQGTDEEYDDGRGGKSAAKVEVVKVLVAAKIAGGKKAQARRRLG